MLLMKEAHIAKVPSSEMVGALVAVAVRALVEDNRDPEKIHKLVSYAIALLGGPAKATPPSDIN
jgi:L-cysteine desulfidase